VKVAEIQLEARGKRFLAGERIKKIMHSKYPTQCPVQHAKIGHRASIPEWVYSIYTSDLIFIFEITSLNLHTVVNQASGS